MSMRRTFPLSLALPALACLTGMSALWLFALDACQKSAFARLSVVYGLLLETDPALESPFLAALHAAARGGWAGDPAFLARYGYSAADFGTGLPWMASALCILTAGAVFFLCLGAAHRQRRRIEGLTAYLEQVNAGAPSLLTPDGEDAFSPLQDELYKTVTALYATRDKALQARQNFADNLANIAHQLKTPLTAAFLSLEQMESASPNLCKTMRNQLEQLQRMEQTLLDLSRVDAGVLQLAREPVDIYTALELAAENLNSLAEAAGVSVEVPEKGPAAFQGDLAWTVEALANLLKNCIQHTPRGSCVHCDYGENPLYVQIRIWDEGPGFAPADLPHLFDRFYQGQNAAAGSTGIGLALARAVLEQQNGTLTACNLPGAGACFELHLYRH